MPDTQVPWGGLGFMIALLVAGVVLGHVVVRWQTGSRRDPVARLVRSGAADWAAFGWIVTGAEHLGAVPPPRLLAWSEAASAGARRPSGILSVKDGMVTWSPDGIALGLGHVAVTRAAADLPVARTSLRRRVNGARYRVLRIDVPGPDVVLHLHTEAGNPPAEWLSGRRSAVPPR
jgi:hypothetical protein